MSRSLLILAALLVAPGLAGWRLAGGNGIWFLLGWYAAASGFTYFLYADDKRRAQRGVWRAPESTLHLCELAGGWPGAFLAQQWLRHKSSKAGYLFTFWLIVGVHQFAAADYLLGWRFTRAAVRAIGG
jgi:uncharacterized membrane protein YsdA (DUF1294 family)